MGTRAVCQSLQWMTSGMNWRAGIRETMAREKKPNRSPGNEVEVILPLYQRVSDKWKDQLEFICHIEVPLGWRRVYCGLFRLEKDGVLWYFVDNEYYFKRDALYGHYDDGERFGFFSRAIVSLMPALQFMPEGALRCMTLSMPWAKKA